MALSAGSRLGPYEILVPIGAGGMGEVYRAKDTRLDRDVAIKVLPVAFARDPDRLARFEREAKAIAALSHPNVLAIFDTGTYDGHVCVVTELLTGATLREVLEGGALPVRKTIEYAIQIARGLAAAHDKGLVHRDLKPDNVFVLADGQIKILDFGLARTLSDSTGEDTRTRAITDAGTVLGTVGYMAPEQVRGQAVDARADLFALGAVIYEMLSGGRAFHRETSAETMTAILKDDPPELSGSRPEMSPAIDRIIRHCLEKNPQERFQTARDVAFALGALSGSDIRSASGAIAVTPGRFAWLTGERLAWSVASIGLAAVAGWLLLSRPVADPSPATPVHATLLLPEGETLMQGTPSRRFAVSPDGRYLAFIATSPRHGEMLFVQSLTDGQVRRVEGSDSAFGPFWSPDSRSIAFRSKDQLLKVDLSLGRPAQIGTTRSSGTWGLDGVIVTLDNSGQGGTFSSMLRLQSDAGGAASDALPAPSDPSAGFAFPSFLPDGRTLMFGFRKSTVGDAWGVYTSRLGSGAMQKVENLVPSGAVIGPFLVASGHLLYARDRMIVAQPFDERRMRVMGDPVVIAGPVDSQTIGGSAFAVSQNGVLVYQSAGSLGGATHIEWFDRTGKPLGRLGEDADYSNLELSPDGSKLAVSVTDPAQRARDIWVFDITRGIRSRFTFDPSDERSAAWSADGTALIYTSKGLDLYTKPLGAGAEQPLVVDHVSKDPRGVSANGAVVYRATGRATSNDIWVKFGDDAPKPFLNTPFDENWATLSPDGKWMAYASDETGQYEVYVTQFPSGAGKWQISEGGASLPRWRHDGRELFYMSSDLRLFAVKIMASGNQFNVGASEKLFQTTAVRTPGSSYDVTPDGSRFIVNTTIPTGEPPSLVVISNWPALIKKSK